MANAKVDLYESIFGEIAREKYNVFPGKLIRPLLEWALVGGDPAVWSFRGYTIERWEFNLLSNTLFPNRDWKWALMLVNDSIPMEEKMIGETGLAGGILSGGYSNAAANAQRYSAQNASYQEMQQASYREAFRGIQSPQFIKMEPHPTVEVDTYTNAPRKIEI